MSYKEKDFQTKFNKWLRHTWNKSGAFELKICKEKSFNFSLVKTHQVEALFATKHNKIAYKIPDDSVGYKPYDTMFFCKAEAWVVIMFYQRGEKKFYMIDIDDWKKEIENSKRKSLTKERAAEIGLTCLLDKKECTLPRSTLNLENAFFT